MAPASPRAAFSVIELAISAAIVALLASAAFLVIGEEPQEARIVRARNELSRMAREVQGRSLTAPNYHFDTLTQALGLTEPPLDPWGHPYVLMHGQAGYDYRPEKTYWSDGVTDALFAPGTAGESGQILSAHWIVSAGPNEAFYQHRPEGSYDPEVDDLKVALKLGKPILAQGPVQQEYFESLGTVRALSGKLVLLPYDFGIPDGDRVRFVLNGTPVVEDFLLTSYPGGRLEIALEPGLNVLGVVALNEGSEPPNTASMAFENIALGGSDTVTWSLRKGGSGVVHIEAPKP